MYVARSQLLALGKHRQATARGWKRLHGGHGSCTAHVHDVRLRNRQAPDYSCLSETASDVLASIFSELS